MKLVNIPSSNLDDVWSLVKKDISQALSYSGNHTDAQFVYDYVKENKIDLLIVDYPKLSIEEITLFDDIINVIHHKSHCHVLTTKS